MGAGLPGRYRKCYKGEVGAISNTERSPMAQIYAIYRHHKTGERLVIPDGYQFPPGCLPAEWSLVRTIREDKLETDVLAAVNARGHHRS